jgi:transposase-like protein
LVIGGDVEIVGKSKRVSLVDHRFSLNLRDIEELPLERGVTVSYETVRQWCDRFGTQFARRAKEPS